MHKIKQFNYQAAVKIFAAGLYVTALLSPSQANAQFSLPMPSPEGVETDLFAVFEQVANIMLAVIGAVAVIMLIVGGFRYVVSGGDSSSVETAKNTILYAIVGLVVAFLAYAAVNFLIGRLQT